jgi:hypothetical protein
LGGNRLLLRPRPASAEKKQNHGKRQELRCTFHSPRIPQSQADGKSAGS